MQIDNHISTLNLVVGQTHRGPCPVCGGKNTFTAARKPTGVIYNCYKAGCTLTGIIPLSAPKDYIADRIRRRLKVETKKPWVAPETFVNVHNSDIAVRLLKRWHSYDAVMEGAVTVRYDTHQNRLVFLIGEEDAVGRGLTVGCVPKWFRYSNSGLPLVVGRGRSNNIAVVVEDAFSACSVYGAGLVGIGLLGTNLSAGWVKDLSTYKQVIIALDPDASKKSLDIANHLRYYVPTKVMFIKDDLKYFDKDQVLDILKLREK